VRLFLLALNGLQGWGLILNDLTPKTIEWNHSVYATLRGPILILCTIEWGSQSPQLNGVCV